MKKEVSNKIDPKKVTLPEVMEKYGCMFSLELKEGWAHIKFIDKEMYVSWLNEEGYEVDNDNQISIKDIQRVADFMRDMEALKLPEYCK
jgi:hypothetical protein